MLKATSFERKSDRLIGTGFSLLSFVQFRLASILIVGIVAAVSASDLVWGETVEQKVPVNSNLPGTIKVVGDTNPLSPTGTQIDSARFTVKQFTFSGNRLVTSEELAPLFSSLQNRPISYAELAQACKQVTEIYRDRGYLLAAATIPVQQLRDEQLDIRVTEGYVAEISVKSDKAQYVSLAQQSFQPLLNRRPLTVAMVDQAINQLLNSQKNIAVELTFTLQRTLPGPSLLTIKVNSVSK